MQIQELTQLEKQKEEMLHKAELAAALVERVPRSILLAELINRMPERLALLQFDMKSEKMKPPAAPQDKDSKGRLVTKAKAKGKTKEEAEETVNKVESPKHKVTIAMVGVAPTDLEVSRYMTELNNFPLLREVTLEYSEQKDFSGRMMRQFKINLSLDPEADVRTDRPPQCPAHPQSDGRRPADLTGNAARSEQRVGHARTPRRATNHAIRIP